MSNDEKKDQRRTGADSSRTSCDRSPASQAIVFTRDLDVLRDELNKSIEDRAKLRQKNEELGQEADRVAAENEALREEVSKAWKAHAEELGRDIYATAGELRVTRQALAELEAENESLLIAVQRESDWVNGLQGQVAKLRGENEELKTVAETDNKDMARLFEQNEELKKQKNAALSQFAKNLGAKSDTVYWTGEKFLFDVSPAEAIDAVIDADIAKQQLNAGISAANEAALREFAAQTQPSRRSVSVGDIVWYVPPQDCQGKTTLDRYAAIVTQANVGGFAAGFPRYMHDIVELCTFGPNSIYFQHAVQFSAHLAAGCWTWKDRE